MYWKFVFLTICSASVTWAQAPAASPPSMAETAAGQPTAGAEQATPAEPSAARGQGKRTAQEEIVVTGTRIPRKDLTTPAPVTVIGRQEIQASGKVSISDFLQTLPEQGNAINTALNNGGNGSTRISLRGLGAARTLVLLNGRRFVPGGTGADASVDLNSIPAGAIERVEVLKDGASAVYGSDAIGGVVNLITRKRFNGTEVSAYSGTSTHRDGAVYDLSATAGTSGEQGNLLITLGYFTQRPVFAGDRSWSRIPLAYDTRTGVTSEGSPTGPRTVITLPQSQRGQTVPYDPSRPNLNPQIDRFNQLMNECTAANRATCPQQYISDGTTPTGWRPFRGVALEQNGGDGYNFAPDNYLVTPQQRISAFAIGDTRLGSSARGYVEASYVNRQSDQLLAPEPLGTGGERVVTSRDSIYNPFGIDLGSVNRRLFEFGGRNYLQDINTFRVVTGVDGHLPQDAGPLKDWSWDVSFNYGRTQGTNVRHGLIKLTGLRNALGPSFYDDSGVPRCGTRANPIDRQDCVPLNLFAPYTPGQPGGMTPDQYAKLTYIGNGTGTNQMTSVAFNTNGELFRLLAERSVALALGYEHRRLSGAFIPDPLVVAGETSGNKQDITQGSYYVNEAYGELSIPLVDAVPLAESLEATAAARWSRYSNFGNAFTYKFGARWSPVRDLTLRGTYSTGFRAPSIADLFLGAADSFPRVQDPCRGANAPATCGAAAGNGDTRVQLNAPNLGNPALRPETSKTFTIGVVFEPRFVKNLSITADYYNIAIDETIGSFGASVILNNCYGTGDPTYCSLIERDPGTRWISRILNRAQNVGTDRAAGVDLSLNYSLPTQAGRFAVLFDGTWTQKFDRTLADGTLVHGKDTYDLTSGSLGQIFPSFKFTSGLRWSLERVSAGVTTRFLGAFRECGAPVTGSPGEFAFSGSGLCYRLPVIDSADSRRVSPFNAWDVFASYAFPSLFGTTTISAGVTNLFDARPPTIYNGFTAASDPAAYPDGFMGRFFYGRLGHSF